MTPSPAPTATLLALRGIRKHFGGVVALDGVDFSRPQLEVHPAQCDHAAEVLADAAQREQRGRGCRGRGHFASSRLAAFSLVMSFTGTTMSLSTGFPARWS